ncbi:hypothetical protein ACIA74_25800 [Streptomyces sp. NPDC051658]|uniref:hypothetical protein n=1 Tax=Streptomyces sp. NPDC051658 TaxID=3365667 RepID=UPI0037906D26
MQELYGVNLSNVIDRDSALHLSNLHIERCAFYNCVLSASRHPDLRTRISDSTLLNCEADNCNVFNVALTNVRVENLKTGEDPLFVWGAKFSSVTLAGNFDRLVINSRVNPPAISIGDPEEFRKANTFHGPSDWALDLSDVHALELTLRGIPARRVRIDQRTQAVVRRSMVPSHNKWRSACDGTWWDRTIGAMMNSDHDDVVLVTPRLRPDADIFIRSIEKLRSLGIADPAK